MAEYVNDPKFYEEYCIWKDQWRASQAAGTDPPRITEYLGECILKICTNLSYSKNFIAYSYRQEMIDDGVLVCLTKFHLFDETKYKKPFNYFTQIAFYEFVKRIKTEKREQKTKIEMIMQNVYEGIATQEFDSEDYQTQIKELIISTIDSNSIDDKMRELSIQEMLGVATVKQIEDTDFGMDIFGEDEENV
jgi:hypothetical protein